MSGFFAIHLGTFGGGWSAAFRLDDCSRGAIGSHASAPQLGTLMANVRGAVVLSPDRWLEEPPPPGWVPLGVELEPALGEP